MTWIAALFRKFKNFYSRSLSWLVNMKVFYKFVILLSALRSLNSLPLEKIAKLVSYKNEVAQDSYYFT